MMVTISSSVLGMTLKSRKISTHEPHAFLDLFSEMEHENSSSVPVFEFDCWVIEYSRGIIASEGYDRVRRLVKSCVSDTSEPSE